jgi:hypothetical protein
MTIDSFQSELQDSHRRGRWMDSLAMIKAFLTSKRCAELTQSSSTSTSNPSASKLLELLSTTLPAILQQEIQFLVKQLDQSESSSSTSIKQAQSSAQSVIAILKVQTADCE